MPRMRRTAPTGKLAAKTILLPAQVEKKHLRLQISIYTGIERDSDLFQEDALVQGLVKPKSKVGMAERVSYPVG